MAMFKDADELKEVLGGFFRELVERRKNDDPEISGPFDKLNATKLTVVFDLRKPELKITIDCTESPIRIGFDESVKADATFIVDADAGHKFWLGKINLAKAIATKEIVALGPVPKLLRLLPTVKKFYPVYENYLKRQGREDLV